MIDLKSKIRKLKSQIAGGLIVSCQAPANSPLCQPEIIAALAQTAARNGAVGVRIDSPAHVRAVRQAVEAPILGIYKVVYDSSEVYITPTFNDAAKIAAAGADVIATDATLRARPNDESLTEIVSRIREELNLPVMADAATLEEGLHAAEAAGADFVGTTLSGYTGATAHLIAKPDFELVERLAVRLAVPVICEGRLRSVEDVRRAFDCGAFAVVVGGAITGIDRTVSDFAAATPHYSLNIQTKASG